MKNLPIVEVVATYKDTCVTMVGELSRGVQVAMRPLTSAQPGCDYGRQLCTTVHAQPLGSEPGQEDMRMNFFVLNQTPPIPLLLCTLRPCPADFTSDPHGANLLQNVYMAFAMLTYRYEASD